MDDEMRAVLVAARHPDDASARAWFELLRSAYRDTVDSGGDVETLLAAVEAGWSDTDDVAALREALRSGASLDTVGTLAALSDDELNAARPGDVTDPAPAEPSEPAEPSGPAGPPVTGDVRELGWVTHAQYTSVTPHVPAGGDWARFLTGRLDDWWPTWHTADPDTLRGWLDGALPALGPAPVVEAPVVMAPVVEATAPVSDPAVAIGDVVASSAADDPELAALLAELTEAQLAEAITLAMARVAQQTEATR